ncbi:MAG: WD40 repeat domain-containing protein [Planctomycetaceae bacterium]|nr:WD40 repeat domain-containing protein [Planctomycetaceae bacterium]
MKKIVLPIILAVWVAWATEVPAQTVIEATKIVRLHDEIGRNSPIPIVKSLDLGQQGQLLAFGGDDHIVRLWNIQSQRFVAPLRGHREAILGLTFSPDAARLATVAQDGQIHFWNVRDGNRLRTLNEPVRGTRVIMFKSDGSRFAVSGYDNNVRIYDAATYQLVATLPTHDTNNEAIAYSTDGSLLAVGGRTGVVRIWRTSDNRHLTDIEGDGRRVRAIAFSPDGSSLATGGDGPFIMLWNPQTGKLIRIFNERPGRTFSLAFCGSETLASGESDNMVRLWDPATGKQIATLSGHTGTISTMTYEPKSQHLVTGSFDASVRFWILPSSPAAAVHVTESPITPDAPVMLSVASAPAIVPAVAETAEPIATSFAALLDFPEETLPLTIITPELQELQPPSHDLHHTSTETQ